MVNLYLDFVNEGLVQYRFYPEDQKEDFGIVQVHRATHKRICLKDVDKSKYCIWYKFHVWQAIDEYIDKNRFPEHGVAIWY